tara:strand:+ start:2602 stop:4086 length:1485 start_codon:yes stop_codon:yes gene_type:complete
MQKTLPNFLEMENMEEYFAPFRNNIIGVDESFTDTYGTKKVIYADWIASGRLYRPMENALLEKLGPFISNPHSYSSYTGQQVTQAYAEARKIIRDHVNADENDCLVTTGSGMTGALMRLQEMLGLKSGKELKGREKPVVFITHMEHHSNQVSWMETCADVVVLPPAKDVLVDPEILENALKDYKDRKTKIGAFTACSNVTGIITPYYDLAEIMHNHGGICIVDFAASAPYVDMDMHPENPKHKLDAICFSPHKFLGGPGACGILLFDKALHCGRPCVPGGGNVRWTDPWGKFGYTSDIEAQEDGGTPGFIQAIRAAMAIKIKEQMNVQLMHKRELSLLKKCFSEFESIDGLEIVGGTNTEIPRIGAVAFNIEGLHYNLVVRLLNDYFGIQARGGWSCASTYCHFLFDIDKEASNSLTERIEANNLTGKPGWVRISVHPTMADWELEELIKAVKYLRSNRESLLKDYYFEPKNNEYYPKDSDKLLKVNRQAFFEF